MVSSLEKNTVPVPNPPQEGWLEHTASAAWDATSKGVSYAVHEVVDTCEKHPVLTSVVAVTALAAVGVPIARRSLDLMAAKSALELETGIATADPFRSLINIGGYGSSKVRAVQMEKIIAAARDGVISGDLSGGKQVEQFIARRYLPEFRRNELADMSRTYDQAWPFNKHRKYIPTLESLVGKSSHMAKVTLDDKEFNLVRTVMSAKDGVSWKLPAGKELGQAARTRVDSLFDGLVSDAGERSPRVMNAQIDRVAEMEWLNAQTWKYERGSAGISQLESRTWLEVAGIDSGAYKKGIDPNLEALTRSLPEFKAAYPTFFKEPPTFFTQPKLNLVPRSRQPLLSLPWLKAA